MGLRAKWRAVSALCVLAVAVAGCGGSTPTAPTTPTPEPNPHPYDGDWKGSAAYGQPVALRIVKSVVVQTTLGFAVSGNCGVAGVTSLTSGPIQNGAFTLSLTNNLVLASPATMTGSFASTTSMSGTIGPLTVNAGVCDTTDPTTKAAMFYTATR